MIKKVDKVWGHEEWLVNTELYCCKILYVIEGYCCSLHFHTIKDETFYLKSGRILLHLNGGKIILNVGSSIRVRPGNRHKFYALKTSKIIEVSTHHEDNDSYRLDKSSTFNHQDIS